MSGLSDFKILWNHVVSWIPTLAMNSWMNDRYGRKYQIDIGGSHLTSVYRKKQMEVWMDGFLKGCQMQSDIHLFRLDMKAYQIKTIIEGAGFQVNRLTESLLFMIYREVKLEDSNGYYIQEMEKRYAGDMRYKEYRLTKTER